MVSLEGNQAAVLYGVNDLRVQPYEVDMKKMKPTDVLVRVQAVGICGSDVHYLRKGERLFLNLNDYDSYFLL